MKILKMSTLTILGLAFLTGCGGAVTKNDTISQPHKIDRTVLEKFKKDGSIARLSITNNSTDYSFSLTPSQNSKIKAHKQIYIDIDRSGNSGYTLFEKEGIGAEYLLEDGNLFKYKGIGGSNWSWEYLGNFAGDKSYSKIPLDFFGKSVSLFDIQATILDENWDVRYTSNLERVTKSIDVDANKVVFDSQETGFTISNDDLNYYFNIYDDYAHRIFFVNSDKNNSTGFEYGYDYIIEDKTLYKYIGTNGSSEWKWQKIDRVSTYTKYRHAGKITSVPKKLISDWLESIKVYAVGYDKNWDEKVATNSETYTSKIKNNFILKIKTNQEQQPYPGVTNTFEIFTKGDGYNFSVDCDSDGNFETLNQTSDYTCVYDTAGVYTMTIAGTYPHLYFNDFEKKHHHNAYKILELKQWGTQKWKSMKEMFHQAKNMIVVANDNPDTSKVTNMSKMFFFSEKFNSNISDWDVSNVTDMSHMFEATKEFNQNIGRWNVSHVTDMNYMFYGAKEFNQNIGRWNVNNVIDMSYMFQGAKSFNQDISRWNVSHVTDMGSMFSYAEYFNQDISNWDVSSVTSMGSMFLRTDSFNQNISNWDIGSVTYMPNMFNSDFPQEYRPKK